MSAPIAPGVSSRAQKLTLLPFSCPSAGPLVQHLTKHIDRYMAPSLEFKRLNCKELVPVDRLTCVRTFTRLFDAHANQVGAELLCSCFWLVAAYQVARQRCNAPALLYHSRSLGRAPPTQEGGVELASYSRSLARARPSQEGGIEPSEAGGEGWAAMVELWFLYCLMWGVGGSCDDDGRKRFDAFMRWVRCMTGTAAAPQQQQQQQLVCSAALCSCATTRCSKPSLDYSQQPHVRRPCMPAWWHTPATPQPHPRLPPRPSFPAQGDGQPLPGSRQRV